MKKYRANLDPSLILNTEKELSFYWIRLKRWRKVPGQFQPKEETSLQCYYVKDWEQIMKGTQGQLPGKRGNTIPFYVTGWQEYEILHDPTLTTDVKTLEIKE